MAILHPIIHCMLEREPKSYHKWDYSGEVRTYSVNLSVEIRSDGDPHQLEQDEISAQALFLDICSRLSNVTFYYSEQGGTDVPKPVLEQVTDPLFDSTAFHNWLVKRQAAAPAGRFWTTTQMQDTGAAIEASRADAFTLSRAVSSWDAPMGHRIHFTHLVRLPRSDAPVIVLPYFDDPMGRQPTLSTTLPSPPGLQNFDYFPDANWMPIVAQTNIFVTYFDEGPLPTSQSAAIPDPDIDANGFLLLSQGAEEFSRFLDRLDATSPSLLSANAGLQFWDEEEQIKLEDRIKIQNTGTPEQPNYNWGAACWFTMARLTTALDPLVLALWQKGPGDPVGGPLLAPLAVAIMDALDDKRVLEPSVPDFEPHQIFKAVRDLLSDKCPLMGTASQAQLGPAIKHVFAIEPARIDAAGNVITDQPPAALVALLADDYHGQVDGGAPQSAYGFLPGVLGSVAENLTIAIGDLEQKLDDEAGAEQALLRIFDTVELGGNSPFAEQLAQKLNQPALIGTHYDHLLAGVREGWESYRTMLSGPFNGAEAVRRAVAGAAASTLLEVANNPSAPLRPTVAQLQQLLNTANYHAHRLYDPASAGCFDTFRLLLVVPNPRTPDNPPKAPDFTHELMLSYKNSLGSSAVNSGRFIPDSFPRPMPIQIASGMDSDRLDAFAQSFNGICVSLRRLDDPQSSWAYANLADLKWDSTVEDGRVRAALDPVMPASTDGRGTMFLNYEGAPFADRPDLETTDIRKYDFSSPFYDASPHAFDTGPTFEKLPRLAYGRTFESLSFVTTNAGTLPLRLQSTRGPWFPRERLQLLWDDTELDPLGNPWVPTTVVKYQYRRRTAISQMAVVEDGQARQPARIGREITGVMPLSKDYPRLGTVARVNEDGAIELFRDTDGVGRMEFPKEAISVPLSWLLKDLIASAPTGPLIIRIFEGPAEAPDSKGFKEFRLDAGLAGSPVDLELRLEDIDPAHPSGRSTGRWLILLFNGSLAGAHFLGAANANGEFTERLCWVRVNVAAKPGPAVSISLVDPDGQRPGGQGVPLLLLAPTEAAPWQKGHSKEVKTVIRTPRVGYTDFIRWMANSQLATGAFGTTPDQQSKAQQFSMLLAMVNRMRHLDKNLSQYLDTLPDPAVEKIVLEVQVTDHLRGARPAPAVKEFNVPKLGDWLAGITLPDYATLSPKTMIAIASVFQSLDLHFSFRVTINRDSSVKPDTFEALSKSGEGDFDVRVSSACVARFAMHALVPVHHFDESNSGLYPSVFDRGLLQYSTRLMGSYAAFYAGACLVETMYDGMGALMERDNLLATELAAQMITVHQVPSTRRYDLITAQTADDRFRNHWRLISEIDVITQRWRPTGRPIYHYIEPRKHAHPNTGGGQHPSLPLGATGMAMGALDQFEREAFFDRPNVDAHTITQRLSPLPASTVLQEFPWDAPSATYFRHRFILRSRYAGALNSEQNAVAWRSEDKNLPTRSNVWTMRIAMLADRSRLKLTRPQLRGLIPLTSTPVASDASLIAPPVAAVLQEPPFSRGGLADRIAAEIRTGFGYGFDKKQDKNQDETTIFLVKVKDSRKEIGPNPQLDYKPFPSKRVLALALQAEGPLGLTFDPTESSTPALPNSMILLRPVTLDDGEEPALNDLQEALAGVSMRRYMDPEWLTGVPLVEDSTDAIRQFLITDITKCWWIEIDQAGGIVSYALGAQKPVKILEIVRQGNNLVVCALKHPIDSGVGQEVQSVEIGRFRAVRNGRPKILHQETTPGQYLISVLVDHTSSRTDDGAQNVPLTVCSIAWAPPPTRSSGQEATPSQPVHLIIENGGSALTIWETMASESTELRWTQVNRDFDYVNIVDLRASAGDRQKPAPVRVDRLQASIVGKRSVAFKTKGNNLAATICCTTTGNPYPAHVHRHVAMITSSFAGELGRPIEKFCRAALSFGARPSFTVDAETPEHALRVIEFETPASIICANDIQAPAAYRTAYFDLIRTGYQKDDGLLLTLRFVGSRQHLKSFSKVTLDLSQSEVAEKLVPKVRISQEIEKTSVPVTLHAYIDAQEVRSWIVYEDKIGEILPTGHELTLNPERVPGFHLTVASPNPLNAEFWTDVSLLHGKIKGKDGVTLDPRSIAFDFNWLFSPEVGGDPAELVSPRGLSAMVEAQARIVTVSPPIPLTAGDA